VPSDGSGDGGRHWVCRGCGYRWLQTDDRNVDELTCNECGGQMESIDNHDTN